MASAIALPVSGGAAAGTARCEGIPQELGRAIETNPSDFLVSGRMTWKPDGAQIDSVTNLKQISTCENGYCSHHFFVSKDADPGCAWAFTVKLPESAATGSSIILGEDQIEANQKNYRKCALLFRGHCYKE